MTGILVGLLVGLVVGAGAVFAFVQCRHWLRASGRTGCEPREMFVVFTAFFLLCMLLPGGAFLDVLSYRYVMPFVGLAALSAAAGLQIVARWSRAAAVLLGAMCVAGFVIGDYRWYRGLVPDDSDRRVIDCLEQRGLHAATAEYWTAYRLTFESNERLIVAPDTGFDRYGPYTAVVRAAPTSVHIDLWSVPPPPGFQIICSTPSLHVSIRGTG